MWEYIQTDELYHHGILGQKWGVRRYQNKDGTLTPAGRRRLAKTEYKLETFDIKKKYTSSMARAKSDVSKIKAEGQYRQAIRDAKVKYNNALTEIKNEQNAGKLAEEEAEKAKREQTKRYVKAALIAGGAIGAVALMKRSADKAQEEKEATAKKEFNDLLKSISNEPASASDPKAERKNKKLDKELEKSMNAAIRDKERAEEKARRREEAEAKAEEKAEAKAKAKAERIWDSGLAKSRREIERDARKNERAEARAEERDRKNVEAEARAEEKARKKEEAKARAEERAEESRRKAEERAEESRRRAEERAEESRRRAEERAEESRRRSEEEARKKAEAEESRRKAEEEKNRDTEIRELKRALAVLDNNSLDAKTSRTQNNRTEYVSPEDVSIAYDIPPARSKIAPFVRDIIVDDFVDVTPKQVTKNFVAGLLESSLSRALIEKQKGD